MWCIDPSSHRAELTRRICGLLAEHFPPDKKLTGSGAKYGKEVDGIAATRKAFLKQISKLRKEAMRQHRYLVFYSWKKLRFDHPVSLERMVAKFEATTSKLSSHYVFVRRFIYATARLFQKALRSGKKQKLQDTADSTFDGHDCRTWDLLKRHRVSGKGAKFAMKPVPGIKGPDGHVVIGSSRTADEWIDHHMATEAGQLVDPQAFVDSAVQRHVRAHPVVSTCASVEDIAALAPLTRLLSACTSGRSAGNDAVPAEVYALHPAAFGRLFYSLSFKVSISCQEPVQHKGGNIFSLYKGRHSHDVKANWRGLLLADVLGKKLRRLQRKNLNKVAQRFLGPLQFGGVEGRGTDQATHILRLLQRYCAKHKLSLSVTCVDCVSAFYALIR